MHIPAADEVLLDWGRGTEYSAATRILIRKIHCGQKVVQTVEKGTVILDFTLDSSLDIDSVLQAAGAWQVAGWSNGKREIINRGATPGYLVSFHLADSRFPHWWLEWVRDSGRTTVQMVFLILKILTVAAESAEPDIMSLDIYTRGLLLLVKENNRPKFPIRFGELQAIYSIGEFLNGFEGEIPSPAELVRLSGLKTFRFQTGFRLLFGFPARKMLQHLRMKQAYSRMRSGTENSFAIGKTLGYTYRASFVTAFRAYYGFTPKEAAGYFSE